MNEIQQSSSVHDSVTIKLITYVYVVGKMKMSSWHTGGRTLEDDVRLA